MSSNFSKPQSNHGGSSNPHDRHAAAILRSATDYAIVGLDLDGVITSWNEGARLILGWSDDDAIGQHVDLFFTPEDRVAGISQAEMHAALKHGRGIDERWHLREDGLRFWANGEMLPLLAEDGSVEGFFKILRDRTEQRLAVANLAESEERYRSLYDSIDEGFCLIEVACDNAAKPIDYCFLEVNPAFERQTGLVDAPGKWMRALVPDLEQHWFEVYAKVALSGESARFTLPAQALDSRWYEVFAYRVGEPADRRVAILFSDVTDRHRREARLADREEHLHALNETLVGSEANLRLLLDTMSEGFYAVDRDGVTTTCNAAFLRMLGFASEAEVVGRKLHDVIHHSHPDGSHYAVSDCPIYLAASSGEARHVAEEQFFRIDGLPIWVEYWAVPIVREGDLAGAICTFLDIGERRESEKSKRLAEVRRTALLELSDRLRNLDRSEEMAAISASVVGHALGTVVAGYGHIDESGQRLLVERDWVAPGLVTIAGVHPMRNYGSYIEDLTRGNTVVISDVRSDPRTAGNGATFDALKVGNLINVPIVERGLLTAIFCITAPGTRAWHPDEIAFIRDVAERTRFAIERRRVEEKLQALAATLQEQVAERTEERDQIWQVSRDMLGVSDDQGVWLSVNPAWTSILGWPANAIVGRTSEWLEHPGDRAKTRAEVDKLASGVPTLEFDNRFRTKDGGYRELSWTAVPVEGRLYCVARDVTEQKLHEAALFKTEEQLRQAQKVEAVGQLTGGVAHDFNNLLTVIRGSVDLLRRPNITDERRQRYIDAIADTADRATRLTSQLLAFARRQALKPEIFNAGESLRAVEDMLRTLTGSRITITTDIVDAGGLVDADRSQFDTAIVNMAVNARDAMEGEGDLTIAVDIVDALPAMRSHPAVPGRFVTISITDTGSGIAADQVDRIFEPFFTTKGVGHGTGLGLSQVFGFAKQSGGDIEVVSKVGCGSTFCLYLPLATAAAEIISNREAGEVVTLGEGACILVVEDNPEVGEFARSALQELGYHTALAIDGPSALIELGNDADRFDVVFSDVVMPGMSGIELGQEIRRRHPNLPVILASGYSTVLAEIGTHGFELLQKPYSIDALSRVLRSVADRRKNKQAV